MKTISDISETAHKLNDHHNKCVQSWEETLKAHLFAMYEECEEITDLVKALDNYEGGEYFIDSCGELAYGISIPADIFSLPMIEAFLTRNYGFIDEKRLCQSSGGYISVNWSAGDREYFVYDHEAGKPVMSSRPDIEGHPDISEKVYVAAVIALYQEKAGEFNDVVETDYYGGYDKHFSFNELLARPEVKDLSDREGLQMIIDNYENHNTNEEDRT